MKTATNNRRNRRSMRHNPLRGPTGHTQLSASSEELVLMVDVDRFIHALELSKAKANAPAVIESAEKRTYRPVNWQEAKARDNAADYADVLAYAGSATAAKLFHQPDRIAEGKRRRQPGSWKQEKVYRQWTGCPKRVETKRDKRLAETRKKKREKQLGIPPWDHRMMATLVK